MDLSPSQLLRLRLRSTPAASDFAQVALPVLPEIPGMISASESRYLYWLTSTGYCGAGAVVEVGTWLGRSTSCLAAGLRDAGYLEALHCFDKFEWTRQHARKADLTLRKGQSFKAEFERNVRPVYPQVRVTAGAIQELSWSGGPIEILFLDAPKRLEDISAAFAIFGPSLVPELSLIVLQDYLHEPSYALAAVLSRLSGELELIHVVASGTTVSFLVRKPLEYGAAQPVNWNFMRWDARQTQQAWERVLTSLPHEASDRLDLGMAFLLFDQGKIREACQFARAAKLDDKGRARWMGFAQTYLYNRYRPIFKALRVHPALSPWQAVRSIKGRLRKTIKRRWHEALGALRGGGSRSAADGDSTPK